MSTREYWRIEVPCQSRSGDARILSPVEEYSGEHEAMKAARQWVTFDGIMDHPEVSVIHVTETRKAVRRKNQ